MKHTAGSYLLGVAAVIGAVAACLWPLVIVVTRFRKLRIKISAGELTAEWDYAVGGDLSRALLPYTAPGTRTPYR